MNTTIFCLHCGNKLEPDAHFCPKCGTKVVAPVIKSQTSPKKSPVSDLSPKSSKATLVLCLFFGILGVHRFYVGKIWTGLFMLLSVGGLGAWVLIDLISIIKNQFEDKKGRPLKLTHNLSPIKETGLIGGTIVAWFIICVASVSTVAMYTTVSLVNIVEYQLAALKTGDIEKAYTYNSSVFQKNVPIQNFKRFIDQFPALKNNANSSFKVRKILNNAGFLSGTLTAISGEQTPVEYHLINQDGQWKISNIRILPQVPPPNNNPK